MIPDSTCLPEIQPRYFDNKVEPMRNEALIRQNRSMLRLTRGIRPNLSGEVDLTANPPRFLAQCNRLESERPTPATRAYRRRCVDELVDGLRRKYIGRRRSRHYRRADVSCLKSCRDAHVYEALSSRLSALLCRRHRDDERHRKLLRAEILNTPTAVRRADFATRRDYVLRRVSYLSERQLVDLYENGFDSTFFDDLDNQAFSSDFSL